MYSFFVYFVERECILLCGFTPPVIPFYYSNFFCYFNYYFLFLEIGFIIINLVPICIRVLISIIDYYP